MLHTSIIKYLRKKSNHKTITLQNIDIRNFRRNDVHLNALSENLQANSWKVHVHVRIMRLCMWLIHRSNFLFFSNVSDIPLDYLIVFSNNFMYRYRKKKNDELTSITAMKTDLVPYVEEMKRIFDMERNPACKIIIAFIVLIYNISRLISVAKSNRSEKKKKYFMY